MVEKHDSGGGDGWPSLLEPFRTAGSRIHDFFSPLAEAGATEHFYEIQLELPGVDEEDIDVSLHDNVMTVKGEKHFEQEQEGKTYFFSERSYGAFQRVFRLPGDVDTKNVDATFSKGVLLIRVPKREKDEGTRIKVRPA